MPDALLTFARAENATQLVLGVSRRGWLASLLTGPGVSMRTMRESGDIDVHMVTHSYVGRGRTLPRARGGLNRRRQLAGYGLAVALMPLLTLALANLRSGLNLTSDVLIFLAGVIGVALVGGFIPALDRRGRQARCCSITTSRRRSTDSRSPTATTPSRCSSSSRSGLRSARWWTRQRGARKQAARSGAESELLATTAGSVLRGQRALAAVLDRVREAFGMEVVTLLERQPGGWAPVGVSGEGPVCRPEDADVEMPVGDNLILALRGRPLPATDRRVLGAFAAYAAAALEQGRLTAAAEAARPIAEADRVRTALLAAVSHDLRTPLASAKAAVTSLRSRDIEWDAEDHDELLATADESLDRLAHLVDNLLDMSRLQAGALAVFPRPADLSEIVARSLDDLGPAARIVTVDIPDDLPEVAVDPGILERVIANLIANALRYSPPGTPPLLTGSVLR